MADYQKAGLQSHNVYRKQHGAPKMALVARLNDAANNYAAKLARCQQLVHNSGLDYGENLYMSWGVGGSKSDHVRAACKSWYNEIKMYNFGSPGFSSSTGHFTAMVWVGSTQLGIGVAEIGGCVCVVANYKPWPNMQGSFGANVLRWREVDESDDEDEKERKREEAEKKRQEEEAKKEAEADDKAANSDLPAEVVEAFEKAQNEGGEIGCSELAELLNQHVKIVKKVKFAGFDKTISSLAISLMTIRTGECDTIDVDTFAQVWKRVDCILAAFFEFDKDRSGSLDPFEVKAAFEEAGFKLSYKTFRILQEVLGEVDGMLTLRAFILCFLLLAKLQIVMELNSGGDMFLDFSMKDWLNEELESVVSNE